MNTSSGRISRKLAPISHRDGRQPISPISPIAEGAATNMPIEAAAVPSPMMKLRLAGETSLPSAPITIGNDAAPVPAPTRMPVSTNSAGSLTAPRRAKPAPAQIAPAASTRAVPKRSATAPATGCAIPQVSSWTPTDSEKTSRSHPSAADIGARKTPKDATNPKLRKATTQPARTAALTWARLGGVGAVMVNLFSRGDAPNG